VSNVLKWVLLAVAVLTFSLMGWATLDTYRLSPPQPKRFMTASGTILFTDEDIVAGKGGFQKADLMDYGSLYGMGSYYGEDYTASTLVRLATLTQDRIAHSRFSAAFKDLMPDQQASVTSAMRTQLQQIDLTQADVRTPAELGGAITELQQEITPSLTAVDLDKGWTPAYSLTGHDALHTADFLIYSALTTVARRPGHDWSPLLSAVREPSGLTPQPLWEPGNSDSASRSHPAIKATSHPELRRRRQGDPRAECLEPTLSRAGPAALRFQRRRWKASTR
jgi:nitric oxide reductase subunit B